jgi:uncharacterized membrane protein YphA (DoxX/SURF4 family)
MKNARNVFYWIFTLWLALGMVSTGVVQLLKVKTEVAFITQMGYPVYLLSIIGFWKILGSVAVLVPRFPLLKEWAYAGFFFVMTGAVASHLLSGVMEKMIPAILLLALTIISYFLRPAHRRITLANNA